MSIILPLAREKFATKQLDWVAQSMRAALIRSTWVPDYNTQQYLSSIASFIISRSAVIGNRSADDGYCNGDNPIFNNVAGEEFGSVILYQDSGWDTSSLMVAHITEVNGLPYTPDGSSVELIVDQAFGGFFRL